MKKSEWIQLVIGGVLFVGSVVFLMTKGTLRIDMGKISEDLGVVEVNPVGVSGDLFISPYSAQEIVLEYIAEARYTLDGRWYQVTERDVIDTLRLRADAGTAMRLIMESATYGGNTKSFTDLKKKLSETDIAIVGDEELGVNFNHTKTFIRDKKDALIATANLSYPSFTRNREYRVKVDDAQVITSLEDLYTADWEGRKLQPSMIHESLLVCPINCRGGIDALLDMADESVVMQAQYLEDPQVIARLKTLQNQGVAVRVLLGEFQDESSVAGLDYRIQEDLYNHSKALLIDDEAVLIGSMNYSTNSIERNREISIILNNAQTVGLFKWQFEKDWEANDR